MSKTARPRAKLSRRELRWAGGGIVCLHLTVARIAEGLGVSWNTVNKAVLTEGRCMLIDAPDRFDGVKVIGGDEQVWRPTRRGGRWVSVISDPAPIRDRPVAPAGQGRGPLETSLRDLAAGAHPTLAERG